MALEQVGMEIAVKDSGTPVVRRHQREAEAALEGISRASKRTGQDYSNAIGRDLPAASGRAAESIQRTGNILAGPGSGSLTHGLGKAQQAAILMAGGFSGVGAGAARVTSALSSLLLTGLNPISLVIAGVATGVGLLAEAHQKAAEAAKLHAEEERAFAEAARQSQVEVRGIRSGDPQGERLKDLRAEAAKRDAELAAIDRMRRSGFTSLSPQFQRLHPDMALVGGITTEEQAIARVNELLKQRQAILLTITDIEGRRTAEAARAAELARRVATVPGGPVSGALTERELTDAALFDKAEKMRADELARQMTAAWESIRAQERHQEPLVTSDPARLRATFGLNLGIGDHRIEQKERDLARRMSSEDVFRKRGEQVGAAFVTGISDTLSDAILTGELDLKQFATSMAQTFVREFINALVEASIGGAIRSAFANIFQSAPALIGQGSGPGGGAPTAPLAQTLVVQTNVKAEVVPEELLARTPERLSRAYVAGASGSGSRGGMRA